MGFLSFRMCQLEGNIFYFVFNKKPSSPVAMVRSVHFPRGLPTGSASTVAHGRPRGFPAPGPCSEPQQHLLRVRVHVVQGQAERRQRELTLQALEGRTSRCNPSRRDVERHSTLHTLPRLNFPPLLNPKGVVWLYL